MDDIAAEYLFTCKNNYFLKIYPADDNSKDKDGYKKLIEIAQGFFNKGKLEEFAGFFMESQYFVQLWTAHLILEYGQPDKKLSEECAEIIKQYSESQNETEVAIQEKNWLEKFGSKYNDHTNSPNVKLAVPFFMVKDMKASLEYYIKGLGFKMTFDWHDEQGNVKWCWLEIGKAALMLQEYPSNINISANSNQGIVIYFICEDALAIYNDVLSRGIKAAEPFVGNNMWVVELTDPDSHKIFFESSTDVPEETKYSDWK